MLVKITVIPLIITMVVMIMMMMAVTTVLPTQPPTQPTAGERGWVGGGGCTQLWLLLRPLPLPNDLSIASSWNESNQHSRREEGRGMGWGRGGREKGVNFHKGNWNRQRLWIQTTSFALHYHTAGSPLPESVGAPKGWPACMRLTATNFRFIFPLITVKDQLRMRGNFPCLIK